MRLTNVGKSAQWTTAQVAFVHAIVAILALAMVAESARADSTGDNKPAIDDPLSLFDNDEKMNSLSWESRLPVFKAVAKEGTDSQFYRLVNAYRDSKELEELNYMASGLLSATDSRRLRDAKNVIKSKLGIHNVMRIGRGPVSDDSASNDQGEFPETIERWNNRPLWV